MTKFLLAVFAFAIFLAAPLAAQSQDAHAEILPLVEQMDAAANTHDTDAFMKVFAHEDALVFCFDGQVIHGFDALHEQQLKWWNNGKSDVVYTRAAAPEFVQAAPDVAIVTLVESSARTAADGTKHNGTAAISLVWKKSPAGWRIIYGHESLAFN